MEFGNLSRNLKRFRELAGLSQYQFARLSGISRGRVSLVECGNNQLNEEEQARAERVLKAAIAARYMSVKSIVECRLEPRRETSGDQRR